MSTVLASWVYSVVLRAPPSVKICKLTRGFVTSDYLPIWQVQAIRLPLQVVSSAILVIKRSKRSSGLQFVSW
ncbi:hypothetical protein PanWU01x14_174620 [Parasponia andersonii]|uniref:Uncharacterized protein n=1 Tax=Parasponia andersonii TaxID=3476 RepID=A0A2P5C8M1_PARAD|nr:hypothetical protein PanWU01x14_174620 [Parasponia andersonii]